jgi:hypothetical protein
LILRKYLSETINQHLHYLLGLTISAIPSIFPRDAYKAQKKQVQAIREAPTEHTTPKRRPTSTHQSTKLEHPESRHG